MKLKFEPIDKLKTRITGIVGKYLDLDKYKVFFFGSRVSGWGSERSDIDIGIDGPEQVSPRLLSEIIEEIEAIPVLYKIEVVDFKQVSSDFRKVALKHIEAL